ncbi:hypothetical protein SteCoe_20116 [Stentor coeruleus]|uniref:Uncharacterized protein n=1 Tax=Stentor coeruleus TaxID=5963 RepID=A0A1R2BSN8_9CILI|nr:hypothetical protein SteCoe_20116 [Stentor coeruleus]
MDICLSVKRQRDENPAEYIILSKRHKNFESIFSGLSLDPPVVLQRVTQRKALEDFCPDELLEKTREASSKLQMTRSHDSRMKIIMKYRNQVLEKENTIYCNGEPMVSFSISNTNSENFIIDEYRLCEDESFYPDNGLNFVYDDSESEKESEDSEDSNREDHPYNDYPDEDSSENSSYRSKTSEDYEDYEVED